MAIRSRWCLPLSGRNRAKVSQQKTYQTNARLLIDTAKALVADDQGLLAMDESNPTCQMLREEGSINLGHS